MSTTIKPVNQKAWFLILPVLLCVAFSAILPLMVVVNYSVQDIISPDRRVFVGTEWFAAIMRDEELHGALLRQFIYSFSVLAVELPLGIALALSMPATGWKSSAVLVIVSLSLLIPWNVVGTIWQIFGRTDIGLMGAALQGMGIAYNYTGNASHAWLTVLLMEVPPTKMSLATATTPPPVTARELSLPSEPTRSLLVIVHTVPAPETVPVLPTEPALSPKRTLASQL